MAEVMAVMGLAIRPVTTKPDTAAIRAAAIRPMIRLKVAVSVAAPCSSRAACKAISFLARRASTASSTGAIKPSAGPSGPTMAIASARVAGLRARAEPLVTIFSNQASAALSAASR
ncbi:hypothetical protein D3C80_1264250 [compost metagenome]